MIGTLQAIGNMAAAAAAALTPEAFFLGLEGIATIVPGTSDVSENLVSMGGRLPTAEGPISLKAFDETAQPPEAVFDWVRAAQEATREPSRFTHPNYTHPDYKDRGPKVVTGQEGDRLYAATFNLPPLPKPAGGRPVASAKGREYRKGKEYWLQADRERGELLWAARYYHPDLPWAPPRYYGWKYAGPDSAWQFNQQAPQVWEDLGGEKPAVLSFSTYTTVVEDYQSMIAMVQVLVDCLRVLALGGLSVFLDVGTRRTQLSIDDHEPLDRRRVFYRYGWDPAPFLPEGVDQRRFFEGAGKEELSIDVKYGDKMVFTTQLAPRERGAPNGTLTMTFVNPQVTGGLMPRVLIESAKRTLGIVEILS